MKLLQLVVIVTTSTRNALYEFFTFDLASAKWVTRFHFSPYYSLLGLNKGGIMKKKGDISLHCVLKKVSVQTFLLSQFLLLEFKRLVLIYHQLY
jgi:hypothetical protein